MSIKHKLKITYLKKIKKMTSHQIKVHHLKQIGMEIGEGTWIFSDVIETNEPYLISIGKYCTIASGVRLLTHDASAAYYLDGASDLFGRIEIGNKVFIGVNALVLPGVSIADNCIIGAGSVVTKSIHTSGSVVAGNPAKVIGNIDSLKNKYQNNVLNTYYKSFQEKKEYLLANESLFIKK